VPRHGASSQSTNCCLARLRAELGGARLTRCPRTRTARALLFPPFSLLNPNASPKNKNNHSIFSAFFWKGQVIGTFHRASIDQLAVDLAIQKLRAGACYFSHSFVRPCSSSSALKPPAPSRPHKFVFLLGSKSVNMARTRRIRRRASRNCRGSSGECAPILFFYQLSNNRTFSPQ